MSLSKFESDQMLKHKSLECSGFTASYQSLVSIKSIDVTRLALARSLITLGPHHDPFDLGVYWWALRGIATTFSLLSSNLRPTYGFANQTSSRQKTDAFFLAEALTHWFAQRHLEAIAVAPVEKHLAKIVKMGGKASYPKTMPKYFRHSVKPGGKSEPDFIAFTGNGVHILESKGRSSLPHGTVDEKQINSARNQALRQVCAIATFNGNTPLTRTACVFSFDTVGMRGQITDPPEISPNDLRGNPGSMIRAAYAAVLDPLFLANLEPIYRDYVGVEFARGWKFGIHRGVFERLPKLDGLEEPAPFLDFVRGIEGREMAEDGGDEGNISIGPDGLILIGGRPFDRPRKEF